MGIDCVRPSIRHAEGLEDAVSPGGREIKDTQMRDGRGDEFVGGTARDVRWRFGRWLVENREGGLGHGTILAPAGRPSPSSAPAARRHPRANAWPGSCGAGKYKMSGMKPPHSDETAELPLGTDSDIQARVERLVGRAIQRQLWLLFLDHLAVELPLL